MSLLHPQQLFQPLLDRFTTGASVKHAPWQMHMAQSYRLYPI
ncbi:hypothetical protein [Spirosoma panaciterrae]|nr:hypothetical protein [Spirosoma panaciterrae]